MPKIIKIPETTLRRLPQYLHILRNYVAKGHKQIEIKALSKNTGIKTDKIKDDFKFTNYNLLAGKRMDLDKIIGLIEEILNWKDISVAFLAGVGNLGTALLNYSHFAETGIKIVAGFDKSEEKIGKEINGIKIFPPKKIIDLTKRMHTHIGIITTTEAAAQKTADMMIKGGISAIWNFTSAPLRVPDQIIVQDADILSSLAVLTQKLKKRID